MAEDDDDFSTPLEWPEGSLSEQDDDGRPWMATDADVIAAIDAEDQTGPLLPALGVRVESLHGAASAITTRMDALLSATTSFRSLITDRVSEYAEQVTRAQRAQAADLEEYRHSTDRVVAELRRAVVDSEEAIHRIDTRVEELIADVANLAELARSSIVEGRDYSASADKVTRSVREGLDGFTTRVLERLDQVRDATEIELAAVRADGGRLRQSVSDAAAGWNATRAEAVIDSLREDIEGLRAVVLDWADPAGLRDEMASLRDALGGERPSLGAVGPLIEEMAEVRSEIAALRRRISVRAKGGDGMSDEQLELLAQIVVDKLSASFEVVDGDDG